MTTKTEDPGKTTAIMAYITIVGFIIAFIMNNDKKHPLASYHIRQCLGLLVAGLALSFINIIPVLGQIISLLGSLFLFYLWVVGLINALNAKAKPLPVLGEKFAEWFKGIQQ